MLQNVLKSAPGSRSVSRFHAAVNLDVYQRIKGLGASAFLLQQIDVLVLCRN